MRLAHKIADATIQIMLFKYAPLLLLLCGACNCGDDAPSDAQPDTRDSQPDLSIDASADTIDDDAPESQMDAFLDQSFDSSIDQDVPDTTRDTPPDEEPSTDALEDATSSCPIIGRGGARNERELRVGLYCDELRAMTQTEAAAARLRGVGFRCMNGACTFQSRSPLSASEVSDICQAVSNTDVGPLSCWVFI